LRLFALKQIKEKLAYHAGFTESPSFSIC